MRYAKAAVLVATCALSCERDAEVDPGAPPASARAAAPRAEDGSLLIGGEIVARRSLSERTAFELVATEHGTALVYDAPDEGLRVERLDERAHVRRRAAIASGGARVVEVAAAAGAGRLLVAWVEQADEGVRARAVLGVLEPLQFGAPLELGPASLSTTERGHIAAAVVDRTSQTSGGARFIVFHRGDKEACDEAPSGCVQFPLHQVDDAGATPRRVVLSVPAPCGRGVAGFATAGNRWYYGICALRDGRASTTMFTIEHAPEYAQADAVLAGCVPLGTPVLGGEALLVGQCGRERRAVRLGRREAEVTPVSLEDVRLRCEGGAPVVEAAGASPLRAPLPQGTADLGAVLPAAMAPLDSRALWTGERLLVASGHPTELVVRSWACARAEPTQPR